MASPGRCTEEALKPVNDQTNRTLKPRHIELIGIGGYVQRDLEPCAIVMNTDGRFRHSVIGTALFVQIGNSSSSMLVSIG